MNPETAARAMTRAILACAFVGFAGCGGSVGDGGSLAPAAVGAPATPVTAIAPLAPVAPSAPVTPQTPATPMPSIIPDTSSTPVAPSTPAAPAALPFISVSISSSTSAPLVSVVAQVAQQSSLGAPITTAAIAVNGTALTLDTATNRYRGIIEASIGAPLTINAAIDGVNYTASATLLSGSTTLTSPTAFGATWNSSADNTIQWTNAGGNDATAFSVSVQALNDGAPQRSTQIWPATLISQPVPSGATSVVVPRNSLSPCNCIVVVSGLRLSSFPGAASKSLVAVFSASTAALTVD
jgi:hypothetical protein